MSPNIIGGPTTDGYMELNVPGVRPTKELVGQVWLVQVNAVNASRGVYRTKIERFSPSGKYVQLGGDYHDAELCGWFHPVDVSLLEKL